MKVEPVTCRSGIPKTSGDEASNSWNEVHVELFARGSGVIEDGTERHGTMFHNSLINF